MKILRAEPTGLCFGVRRTLELVECALAAGEPVYAISSPIHNPQEVARLARKGLRVVESAEDVPENAVAVIRAHGAAPAVYERLKTKNARVVDGTCPFVRLAQIRARDLSEAGFHVLILGDEKHPEVAGILGYVTGKATVVSSLSSLFSSTIFRTSAKISKLGLLSQTTQEESLLSAIAQAAADRAGELRVYNTICHATRERQQAVAELAAKVCGVIIIGGHDSANTGKLYRIALGAGCPVQWVEHAGQLDREWVRDKDSIGVAAGASTPDWLIEHLIKAIEEIAGRQGDVRNE